VAADQFSWFSNGSNSGVIDAPALRAFGITFSTSLERYFFSLTIVTVLTFLTWRLMRSATGRHFIAVRDNETAARIIGVPVFKTKLLAAAVSSFIIGVAGVLWAVHLSADGGARGLQPRSFLPDTVHHHYRGAGLDPGRLSGGRPDRRIPAAAVANWRLPARDTFDSGVLDMSQRIVLGAMIILFLIAEPEGLSSLWNRILARLGRTALTFPLPRVGVKPEEP